jgi:anthranilate phosphoribosyltransferase
VRSFEVTPEALGLPRASLDQLKGGEAEDNAAAVSALLDGAPGPFRDIVLLNAAAALVVAGAADGLPEGIAQAAQAIDSGRARGVLARLVAITNEAPVHG